MTGLALLLSALLAAPLPQTLRADVNLVSVYFTVRDKKDRIVTTLAKDAIHVFEDGREQPISFFAKHSDLPLNVGILLDTSTSLARTLGIEAEAAAHFFKTVMQKNDMGFLMSYASRLEVLQVPTEDPSLLARKTEVIRRYARADAMVAPRRAGPAAAPIPMPDMTNLRAARLYDAVGYSVERYLTTEVGRKALVIVALADDARSESTLKDALRTLKQNDVIAYVLEVQHAQRRREMDDCDILHIFRSEEPHRIARLAEETGGRVIRVEGFEKMQDAFDKIAEELHHQYSVGYRPANQNWDGAFRKLVIQSGRGYRISARDGYYATPR